MGVFQLYVKGLEGLTVFPDRRYYTDKYRGVQRDFPGVMSCFYEIDETNKVFSDVFQGLGEWCFFLDAATAIRIRQFIAKYDTIRDYELIEITSGNQEPTRGKIFLGYDVAEGEGLMVTRSLVWEILIHMMSATPGSKEDMIINIYHDYFRSKLNEHGLFGDISEAEWFLKWALTLEKCLPEYFEDLGTVEGYIVVGIWLCDMNQMD